DASPADLVQSLLAGTPAGRQAAGADTSALHGIEVRIAAPGGLPLGKADRVMGPTLTAGTRPAASHGLDPDTSQLAGDAFFALFAAEGETPWIGSHLGRGSNR